MVEPKIPENEDERLAELRSYQILDTPAEQSFDNLTHLAAALFDAPTALVSLVDADRQWFKSAHGIDASETPRCISFCGHAILDHSPLTVLDAALDERFFDNPLVEGDPKIRFYIGAPLITPKGFRIGTLCVIDQRPRERISPEKVQAMQTLAASVIAFMELRLKNKELARVNQQSLDIQRMSHTGGWELDVGTSETLWTDEVYEIYGIDKDIPTNKVNGISYYAEHERERLAKAIEDSIVKNIPFDDVYEFYSEQGEKKFVRSVGRPVCDESGTVVKLVGTFQDVTTFKEKELEAQSMANVLDLALEGAQLGVWDWYLDTNNVNFDRRWAEMLGLDHKEIEMSLSTWESRVHPDDLARVYEDIKKYMDGETDTYENIHRMKHAEGYWVYILDKGRFSNFDENGKPIQFTGTHLDITASERYRKKLSLFFEKSIFGYVFFSADGKMKELNRKFAEIVGREPVELIEKPFIEMVAEDAVDAVLSLSAGDSATRSSSSMRIELKHRDGSQTPVEIHSFQVSDYDGTDGHWIIVEDITEKKILESQLQHSQKLASIGELAAGIGHEINNPLAIAKGYLTTLEKRFPDRTSFDQVAFSDLIHKIKSSADRIEKIVRGLRTFSRSDADDISDFDIKKTLNETTDMLVEIFASEGIKFESNLSDLSDGIMISGNRGKLQQVFINLLANAKDATIAQSPRIISLSVDTEGSSEVSIRVKDNGCGISPENQKKIFEPFFTTKPLNEGTGIGLSLVHNIVSEFHGEISLVSKPNEGAEFIVRLPISEVLVKKSPKPSSSETEGEVSSSPHAQVSSFSDINRLTGNILLVDDEEGIRDILTDILVTLGLNVLAVASAKEALHVYEQKPDKFDFIISDVKMPEMTGMQLFQEIHEKAGRGSRPHLFFITGGVQTNFEDPDSPAAKLIDGYFYKPFDEDEIYRKLSSIVFSEKKKSA